VQINTGAGLGFGDATVSLGSTLQLSGPSFGMTVSNNFFLTGDGLGSSPTQSGVLENVQGPNSVTGRITMRGPSSIGVDGTSQLTLPAGAAGITGGFNLTKVGT